MISSFNGNPISSVWITLRSGAIILIPGGDAMIGTKAMAPSGLQVSTSERWTQRERRAAKSRSQWSVLRADEARDRAAGSAYKYQEQIDEIEVLSEVLSCG
jgi:hypothetical protein